MKKRSTRKVDIPGAVPKMPNPPPPPRRKTPNAPEPSPGEQTEMRASKLELQRRIRIMQNWILEDNSTIDIIANAMKQWGITRRQAYRYLWASKRLFDNNDAKTIEAKRAYYLARFRKLIHDMDDTQKKSPAGVMAVARVLHSMAKIDGVNIETVKVVGDPKAPIPIAQTTIHHFKDMDYESMPTELLEQLIDLAKPRDE